MGRQSSSCLCQGRERIPLRKIQMLVLIQLPNFSLLPAFNFVEVLMQHPQLYNTDSSLFGITFLKLLFLYCACLRSAEAPEDGGRNESFAGHSYASSASGNTSSSLKHLKAFEFPMLSFLFHGYIFFFNPNTSHCCCLCNYISEAFPFSPYFYISQHHLFPPVYPPFDCMQPYLH